MNAGTVNIMFNGPGDGLLPAGNPGFLPGIALTVAAYAASLLIPTPVEAGVAG